MILEEIDLWTLHVSKFVFVLCLKMGKVKDFSSSFHFSNSLLFFFFNIICLTFGY